MQEDTISSDQLFHQILTFLRAQRQHSRRVIDERGIKPRDMSVLYFLAEESDVTVSNIQQFIQHSPSTTSTLIANLEKSGLVTRTRSTTDNRVVRVTLTEQGQTVVREKPLEGLPLLRRELRNLSAERLTTMSGVITELQALMQSDTENS